MEKVNREHLFINYATEDADLAGWLTLKLISEGYRVWCAEFKLLGGESYPKEIDEAIKNRTFRMISLLSHDSIPKSNPKKERTLALNISKERGIDFIIPLNVTNLSPTELDWMTSDITFIPFENWAQGLSQLLKKLNSISTPRPLKNGKEIAVSTFLPTELISKKHEILHLNHLKIRKIPSNIKIFKLRQAIDSQDERILSMNWAFWRVGRVFLSFCPPPEGIKSNLTFSYLGQENWHENENIHKIKSLNLVSNLLRKSVYLKCFQRGLVYSDDSKRVFFPAGLLKDDKLRYIDYKGRKNYFKVTGIRSDSSQAAIDRYRYHLSPEFRVKRGIFDLFDIQIRVRLFLTTPDGQPLAPRSALARRKKITKDWWNDKWLKRYMGISYFLADGTDTLGIGDVPEEQIIISSKFPQLQAPFGIDETSLLAPKSIDITEVDSKNDIKNKFDEDE